MKKEGWICNFEDSEVEILIHEYVHLAIANVFKKKCPLWLNEGLAMYLSGQYLKTDVSQCKGDYPYYSEGYSDDMFYLQSVYAVTKFADKYGIKYITDLAKNCDDFIGDDVFGIENIEALLFYE